MLRELSVENFAIIDRLLIRFSPGFTVLTGETGAGKSIIIDALQTALGARTSSDFVRGQAEYAAVEAVFDGSAECGGPLSTILQESGIPEESSLILRREISATGRGTARVNGRAVPVSTLASIGAQLVDIHGQSEHLSILRRERQLEILDRYGGLWDLRERVTGAVRIYLSLRRQLEERSSGRREAEQRLDLLRFQAREIESANLRIGEEEGLTAERNLLTHAERLAQLAQAAYENLHGESGGALENLGGAVGSARDLSIIDPSLEKLSERLQGAEYELDDIAQELRSYRDAIEYDPHRLGEIEERLDLIARLRRKYGPSVEDVLEFGTQARKDMETVEHLDEQLESIEIEVRDAEQMAGSLAEELSRGRYQARETLTEAMGEALKGLGLKSTNFAVQFTQNPSEEGIPMTDGRRLSITPSGVDAVSYLVSFNPGEPLRPLERAASGGETSRFLLALKSVLADVDRIPTLVFDEVDVGVGGRHGAVVGGRLRDLAKNHQVLTITHMPQIAALADEHVVVVKATGNGRTDVNARLLDEAARVIEIAEMMSGTDTDAARRSAKELREAAKKVR
jgi:DNA repair protein RecN (Recombination protein N)